MPHESLPNVPGSEAEPSVTIEEARAEIVDTVESIITAAIDKAINMKINGIKRAADSLKMGTPLSESQNQRISSNGRQFIDAVNILREKSTILSDGLRDDASNEELVGFVDWLAGHNEFCKTAFDNPDLVKNTDSLISVVNRSANGIQGQLSIGYRPLLRDDAKREISRKFSPPSA